MKTLQDRINQIKNKVTSNTLLNMRVHTGPRKPAALSAEAYAQESPTGLGASQEKHLAHELGHVVQQRQGRAKPI